MDFPIYKTYSTDLFNSFSSLETHSSRQLHQNPHGDHKQQGTNEVTPKGPHTPVD